MYRLACLIILAVSALNPPVEATPSLGAWTAGPPLEDSWDRWDNALKRAGVVNQDSTRAGKGNDLYDGEHVYISGHVFQETQGKMRYSSSRRILSDLRGKTVAQLLLNNDSVAGHLILAEYILSVYVRPGGRFPGGVFSRKKGIRERVGVGSLTLNVPPGFVPPTGCSVWTQYARAGAGECPLCALFQPSSATDAPFTQQEYNDLTHMCSKIMSDYAAKLKDYVAWAQERFKGLWSDASGSPEAHTEIMLLYDYRGRRLPSCVYSRYSMCKTCEPAVVNAVRSQGEWSAPVAGLFFTAEQLYPDSYCAGEPGSRVKKIVLQEKNSNYPIPLDKLRAYGARNDPLEATLSDVWSTAHCVRGPK